ncbi:MAG: hypothetical protein ACM65L_01355 [Microcoleus sp.]
MNKAGAIAASYHLLQTALTGNASDRDDIGYMRAKKIKITTDPPQKVVLDGEIIGMTPLSIECVPGGLTVFVPRIEEEPVTEKLTGLSDLKVVLKENYKQINSGGYKQTVGEYLISNQLT